MLRIESESSGAIRAIGKRSHSRPARDKIVPRKFGKVAKLLWFKPAAEIAVIAHCTERTAKRILRGESAVPVEVLIAANIEMLRRQN